MAPAGVRRLLVGVKWLLLEARRILMEVRAPGARWGSWRGLGGSIQVVP